jgi:hypothetical protein
MGPKKNFGADLGLSETRYAEQTKLTDRRTPARKIKTGGWLQKSAQEMKHLTQI